MKPNGKRKGKVEVRLTGNRGGEFSKLDEFLNKFKRDIAGVDNKILPVLLGLLQHATTFQENLLISKDGFTLGDSATAIYCAAVTMPNLNFESKDSTIYNVDLGNAEKLLRGCADIQNDGFVDSNRQDLAVDPEVALLSLVELISESTIHQSAQKLRIVNSLVLIGQAIFGSLEKNPHLADEIVTERLGFTAGEYLAGVMALWMLVRNGSRINPYTSFHNMESGSRIQKGLVSVLNELSLPMHEFSSSIPPEFNKYTGQSRALAIFSRFPFLKVNDESFFCVNSRFLQLQFSAKFMTKLQAFARMKGGKAKTDLENQLGKVRLEGFVSGLCSQWNPPGGLYAEYEYWQSSNEKSSDQIAFENHGSKQVCILISVKTKMLTESTHFGVTKDSLDRDLAILCEHVSKSVVFLFNIMSGTKGAKLSEEFAELTAKICNSNVFCMLGIAPDLPPIFSLFHVRQKLMESVEKKLDTKQINWFIEILKPKMIWHIMDLIDFEYFLALRPIERNLYKKLTSFFRATECLWNFSMKNKQLPGSFALFLKQQIKTDRKFSEFEIVEVRLPYLEKIYWDFFEDVKSKMASS